jgi:N-acetylglucosaminyl-diphospho-decaprenol L-rhamnosyltransferase
MPGPRVSALVVTYHTGPRLTECLHALKSDPAIGEIILVDNGNPPAAMAWIDRFIARSPAARLFRGGDNPGFGTAVNRAARAANGDLLLVLNPDAVVRRGSVERLAETLADLAAPALVGGRIFDIHGREERGARRHTLTLSRALGLQAWTMEQDPPPPTAIDVGAVSGAFFMMRAADFFALGGFDEAYFLHVEDVDLCRRVHVAGGRVVYEPRAGALHYGATSDAPSAIVTAHKARSLARYFRKFAKGPVEQTLVAVTIPFIHTALRLRG